MSDVNRSHQVSVRGKTADLADEGGLRLAIGFRDKITPRTGLGGMPGVNQLNQDSSKPSFVGDKLTQLVESPGVVASPLAMVNRDPLPDTVKVLKGNQAMGVFSLRHQPLADYVIGISSKVGFSSGELFKMFLSRFGALALERRFKSISLFPDLVHLLSGIKLTIAVNGKVDNTKVNPQCPCGVIWSRLWGINSNCQIENSFTKDKVTLLDNPVDSGFLIFSNPDRHNLASLKGEDRNPIHPLEREDTVIVDHSRMRLKCMQCGLVPAVNLNDLADSPNCHLSRQPIVLSKIAVGKVVKLYLSSSVVLKGKTRKVVTSLVKALHGLKQSIILLTDRSKFNQKSLLHAFSIDPLGLYGKSLRRRIGEFPDFYELYLILKE